MNGPRQLILDFPHRPSLDGEDFLIADNNQEAAAWIDRWPDWPAPALCLYGPPGCGKSHLVHVFLARTSGRLLTAAELAGASPADLLQDHPAIAIDDADRMLETVAAPALLHLYNVTREAGRHLLLTGRRPPAQWPVALADLASRLRAAPAVRIDPPDDALLRWVLAKLFVDRQLKVGDEVLAYLLARIERSFAALEPLVAAIDAAALSSRRAVTIPLVGEVLAKYGGPASPAAD